MGKQNVLLESQNQTFEKILLSQQNMHQDLSDKVDNMQEVFSSQLSELISIVKAYDAKKRKDLQVQVLEPETFAQILNSIIYFKL